MLNQLYRLIAANTRPDYYPGAENRLTDFRLRARQPLEIAAVTLPLIVANTDDDPGFCQQEVFGPGLSVTVLRPIVRKAFCARRSAMRISGCRARWGQYCDPPAPAKRWT